MKILILSAFLISPFCLVSQVNKFSLEGTNELESIIMEGGGSQRGIIEVTNNNGNPQVQLFGDGDIFGGEQFEYGQIQLDGFSEADLANTTDGGFQSLVKLVNEQDEKSYSIGLIDKFFIDELMTKNSQTELAFTYQGSIISRINTNGDYIQISDERLKRNIKDIGTVLPKLKNIKTINYTTVNSNHKEYGFLAQDLNKMFPVLVDLIKLEGQETYMVNYNGMIPVLTKAIQEQQLLIETLQEEVQSLKKNKKRKRGK